MHFDLGPFSFSFNRPAEQPAPVAAPQAQEEVKPQEPVKEVKKINEFTTIVTEFASVDLKAFTEKYPFISAIATIAFGFFGLLNVLSLFSPTSIITGIFFGVLSISLGKSLWNINGLFWKVWDSGKFSFSTMPKAEEPVLAAPAAPAQPAPVQAAPAPVKV